MSISAGDLREHCTIQSVTRGSDSAGNTTETWSDGVTVACKVDSVSGKDYFTAAAIHQETTVTFTIRFRSDLDSKSTRIKFNGQQYGIKEINVLGLRRDFLKLKCMEITGTGVRT